MRTALYDAVYFWIANSKLRSKKLQLTSAFPYKSIHFSVAQTDKMSITNIKFFRKPTEQWYVDVKILYFFKMMVIWDFKLTCISHCQQLWNESYIFSINTFLLYYLDKILFTQYVCHYMSKILNNDYNPLRPFASI